MALAFLWFQVSHDLVSQGAQAVLLGPALHGDLAPLADWLMVFLLGERGWESGEGGEKREKLVFIIPHFKEVMTIII